MFFSFCLCAFFSFASFEYLNADYTLSFNASDLYFLQKVICLSDSEDKNCTGPMKQKAIDGFIRYGHKNGFASKTQFGKGYQVNQPEGKFYQILLDPAKFNLSPDTQLTVNIHSTGIISKAFRFTLSPAMHNLVEKMLKENGNSTQSKI